MSINLGGGGLSSAVQAFLERYGGNPDAEALDVVFGQHDHLASDISGGFANIVLTGPWWSENWNGAIPPDLSSGADPNASAGFAIDPIAGALQALSFFGSSETTVGIGALWFTGTAPTGWLLLNGQTLNAATSPEYQPLYDEIGNDFGGSDNTDFQVPDLRGFFPFMQATSGTGSGALGTTFGAIDHVHTTPNHNHSMQSHTHSGGSHSHSHSHFTADTSGGPSSGSTGGPNSTLTVQSGSGALTAHSGHSHSMQSHTHYVADTTDTDSSGGSATTGGPSTSNTGNDNTSTNSGNPPGFVLNFIIKF